MERVHYRRVAGESARPRTDERGGSRFTEKLIVQAIAASLILVAVMGICLLDYDFTVNARAGLQQALEGRTTFDGIVTDIKQYTDEWFGGGESGAPVIPVVAPAETTGETVPESDADSAVSGDESKSAVPELPFTPEPQ